MFTGIFQKYQIILVQEIHQIHTAHLYFHMPLLLLAKVEQFGHQIAQLYTTPVYTQYFLINNRSKRLQLHQHFHMSDNDSQRCSDFMRNIGKEP